MRRHADITAVTHFVGLDAVAVAVNHLDRAVRQHDAVAVIDIAHHVFVFVQGIKSAGDICRSMHEKMPRRFGKINAAAF